MAWERQNSGRQLWLAARSITSGRGTGIRLLGSRLPVGALAECPGCRMPVGEGLLRRQANGGTLPRCLEENPADRSLWSVRHRAKSRAARVACRGIAAATIDQR
jgi:hypothetical protein